MIFNPSHPKLTLHEKGVVPTAELVVGVPLAGTL